MKRMTMALAALTLLFVSMGQAKADTIDVSASDTGWYDSTGTHTSSNKNYISGVYSGSGYHDYFVFNLAGVTGTITSAQLRIFNNGPPDVGYNGPAQGFNYINYDVTTAIGVLESSNSSRTDIYNDLGSGTQYGSTHVDASANGQFVNVGLDTAALAAISSNLGNLFAVGGGTDGNGSIFTYSHEHVEAHLILTTGDAPSAVPEPATLTMLGFGVVSLVGYGWRRRKLAARVAG